VPPARRRYFAVFLVLAEAIALLFVRKRQARRLPLACVPIVLVLLALAPFASRDERSAAAFTAGPVNLGTARIS
jgi:hypothetical protein